MQKAILGGLAYLEDNQIRDRPGRGSPVRDTSDFGDGACGRTSVNLPCRENAGFPGGQVHNLPGEWASYIHFFPNKTGRRSRSPIAVQDSSLFITASVAYGLVHYDDSLLPPHRQFISEMLHRAVANVQGYKRGAGYNFWPQLPGVESPLPRVGPPNVDVRAMRKVSELSLRLGRWLSRRREDGNEAEKREWLATILDRRINPTGADALLNAPNDADDTAIAVVLQTLYCSHYPQSGIVPDVPALLELPRYRDLDRMRNHPRNDWKPRDTGAFLTWLKHETEPFFAEPQSGILPNGVNDVDAVANANIAFALALNGLKGVPGYMECLGLLASVVDSHLWPEAGVYYPNYMTFPYAVTRAYRVGGACEGPLGPAMKKLLVQLLDEQEAYARSRPARCGAFPGGDDYSDHLSTAMGLCALLNLGRPMACEIGQAERFDRAVCSAVSYLIRAGKPWHIANPSTRQRLGICRAVAWQSGLSFSPGTDAAYWRSRALTVAVVLEALAKYALHYDCDPRPIGSRYLALVPGPCPEGHLVLTVVDSIPSIPSHALPEGAGRRSLRQPLRITWDRAKNNSPISASCSHHVPRDGAPQHGGNR